MARRVRRDRVSVIIADDHRLMREGTAALLAEDPRINVVGLARDGRDALAIALERRPAVALIDLNMPDMHGTDVCRALRDVLPSTRTLILTVSEQEEDLYGAILAGADGYLLKDMPPDHLVEAILDAGNGAPHIAPRMADRLLREFGGAPPPVLPGEPIEPATPAPPTGVSRAKRGRELDAELRERLTSREEEVLTLLAAGLRNREIAEQLVVSEATVKTHVRHVLEKLRFRNRAEATAYAVRRGR